MKRKLLLIVGLAVLGACVAAGTGGRRQRQRGRRRRGRRPDRPPRRRQPRPTSRSCRSARTPADDDGDGAHRPRRPRLHRARSTRPSPAPAAPRRRRPRPPTTTRRRRHRLRRATTTSTGDGDRRAATAAGGGVGRADRRGGARRRQAQDSGGKPGRDRRRRSRRRQRRHPRADGPEPPTATPTARPTDTNPGLTIADFGAGADRRPQLRHRPVHDPALPAADLPGLRDPVRDPVAGARLDQPDRDRVRHQPQRLHRRRARLDAVHALDLEDLRRRRQRRRPQGPLQPGRRDLRRGALPERRRRRTRTCAPRSSPTTTPTGTSTRSCSTRNQYGKLPDDLVSSLTGLTEGAHFPVAADARYADDISEREALERSKPGKARRRQRRRRDLRLAHTSRDQHLLRRRAPRSSRSTTASITEIGKSKKLGKLHRPPGRLRQPLHLRPARRGLRGLPGAEGAQAHRQGLRARHPGDDEAPDQPASAGTPGRRRAPRAGGRPKRSATGRPRATTTSGPVNTEDPRERLYAFPERAQQRRAAPTSPASSTRCSRRRCPATRPSRATSPTCCASTRRRWSCEPLRKGSKVIAGTVLGRIGKTDRARPARPLRDPPGGPRRAEDRPEADPRRLEAARGDRDLPRRRQEPVQRHARPPARCC